MNQPKIAAASVNHNTSAYMELMLRSLFARHSDLPGLSVTVYDNQSEDDTSGMRAFAASRGVPVLPSGYTTQSEYNSHGEILRRFVLDHPDCTHYLFLDADVVFLQDGTLNTLLTELDAHPEAFGIGPRMSGDGISELPIEVLQNPAVYDNRLHPCCALMPNTPLFRKIAEEIGFSCVKYLWPEREEYLDTMQLFTTVMRTHGLRHARSERMILHFFCVSYTWDPEWLRDLKVQRRDDLLAALRQG